MKFFLNSPILWDSKDNHVLMNPKMPQDLAHSLLELLKEVDVEFESHVFILSSGTTSSHSVDLKWVALSKRALLASAAAVNAHISSQQQSDQNSNDHWLQSIPDFHVGGLSISARAYLSGAKVVSPPLEYQWSAGAFVSLVVENRITLASLVPAQVYDLVHEGLVSPPLLRAVFVGGGALGDSLCQRAKALGWPLLPTYGMTEACSQIATAKWESVAHALSLEHEAPMTVLPHLNVRVREDDQRLEFQGESVLSVYVYRSGKHVVVENPKSDTGWYTAQDRVELKGNTLKILGRVGELIKIGGERAELARLREILEATRLELKIQSDLALVAVPHERLGHVIHLVADTSLSAGAAIALQEAYHQKVLGYEKVRKLHVLERIPRTALGKLKIQECLREIGY
jgi:O-succinylbenzoic acid--CoA ligase